MNRKARRIAAKRDYPIRSAYRALSLIWWTKLVRAIGRAMVRKRKAYADKFWHSCQLTLIASISWGSSRNRPDATSFR